MAAHLGSRCVWLLLVGRCGASAAHADDSCAGAAAGTAPACAGELAETLVAEAARLEGEQGESLQLLQTAAGAVAAGGASDASASGANASEASKWADERCLNGYEGTNCVADGSDPTNNPALWTHYTYCSGWPNHRYRLWRTVKSCDETNGALSRCKMSGSLLSRAECDDPFCRTRPDGRYCQNGAIVVCEGDAEPRVVERCAAKYEHQNFAADDDGDAENVECTKTYRYTCHDGHPNPTCGYAGESSSCTIRRRRSGRRRCNDDDDYDSDSGRRRV